MRAIIGILSTVSSVKMVLFVPPVLENGIVEANPPPFRSYHMVLTGLLLSDQWQLMLVGLLTPACATYSFLMGTYIAMLFIDNTAVGIIGDCYCEVLGNMSGEQPDHVTHGYR
jgi:hypothetical protein